MRHVARRFDRVTGLLVFGVFVLSLGNSGCKRLREKAEQKAAEQAIQAGSGGQVTLNDENGGVTMHDKNGNTVSVGESKVPADWPATVPLYPNGKVVSAVSTHENGKAASMVTMQTPDAAATVFAFFKGKLASFDQKSEIDANGTKMLVVEDKKTKRNISVIVTGAVPATTVQVTTNQG